MPLHLLGKKSWNVYNADNIARVQHDEAVARAREEADEQRMQEVDASRRLAILRGESPSPLEVPETRQGQDGESKHSHSHRRDRKRKRTGEDDTDFEMRIAREQAEAGARVAHELSLGAVEQLPSTSSTTTSAPLYDGAGHISLFEPAPATGREKNPEAEREAAKKKREYEDQFQMRLVNAAGKDGLGLTDGGPWYAAADGSEVSNALVPTKNVWGKDDPRRKVREATRLGASDPLAMMKRGAAKVRELDKERRREGEERERELRELRRDERRREKRRRRRHEGEHGGGAKDPADEEGLGRWEHDSDRRHDRQRDENRDGREGSRHGDDDGRHRHRHHRSPEPQRPQDERHRHRRHHHSS
ncbi:hypothetical protein B0T22DRAFT_263688 [Podospora appendiculata]|uniref:CBF1-interacting co-repressor CIR N-terminal domain-containing protein n=1 Tax=Podospora appendiculata TaxID=314037 RepID=A0AAE0X350_9PEZI|nr:hypothetical protein B0T22DRAFT_263688 [Podospora appendiculata]